MKETHRSADALGHRLGPSEKGWERVLGMPEGEYRVFARLTVLSLELEDAMRGWTRYRRSVVMDILKDQVCGPE